jgi:acyl carrier protein
VKRGFVKKGDWSPVLNDAKRNLKSSRAAVLLFWRAAASHRKNTPPLPKLEGNCGMTPAEIREEVIDILADIAPDEDLSGLEDDKPFREQLELDSMDFLDIVMELRKRHRIQIPEENYQNLASMQSTVEYLTPLLKDVVRT